MCRLGSTWTGGLFKRTSTYGRLMTLFYLALISLCRHVRSSSDGDGYRLSTAEVYYAYSGDLEVTYKIPTGVYIPDAFIRLDSVDGGDKEITTLAVSDEIKSSTLRVTCGVVEFAGNFAFRMFMHLDGKKLAETFFEVKWPVIKLTLPPSHVALSGGFTIRMTSEAKCDALIHRYQLWIDLNYVGDDRDLARKGLAKSYKILQENVSSISESTILKDVNCSFVDLAGFYRAELKSSFNNSIVIAMSNLMFATWSNKYNLSTIDNYIFPCHKTFTLYFTQPVCKGGKDKIRTYKWKQEVQGSLAAPVERVYVMERDAPHAGRTLTFNCNTFEQGILGYCFIYVSVSRTRAVSEQKTYCLPTHKGAIFAADGRWSAWSPWGQCSVTCGEGKKSRFRFCNNPPPMNGGRFCIGDSVQWTLCSTVCPESLSKLTPLYSIKVTEDCACGCNMFNGTGKLVATGRCLGLSIWRIRVGRDLRIKLSFAYMNLYKNMQWVQIRNGGSTEADLLAFSDGNTMLGDVLSTTNEMVVEFMTKSESTPSTSLGLFLLEPTESIHVHGFIAYYNVLNNNVTVASARLTPITKPVWENAVTVIGVIVCVLVVVGTVLFVIYHRIQRRRRHKYKMAKTESPTSPVHHKGTSIQTPSSPDELDSPGVDMETPLTGELKRKEYPVNSGKSRGSSISSTSSAGYKRLRNKADMEFGSRHSSRTHTPLQSPYAANASVDDFKHDQNFFKGYRPRSPKVHPSPKTKRSSNSKSPISPPTKHSMLTKALVERRKDEDEGRVVTGASSTPTSKEQSGSASTSKTDDKDPNASKKKKKDKPEIKSAPTEKDRDYKKKDVDSQHKPKSSRKKIKSSGVCTPMDNAVEMEVKGGAPCESSTKQTTTEFTSTKARRPTSLTDSYDSDKAQVSVSPKEKQKFRFMKKREPPKLASPSVTGSTEERQRCLPRPDGQSPESIREERVTASQVSTPKSIKSLRSNRTLSPTKSVRSANTPSDMAELEYDDFIEDDPLSYFEYDEMLKLRWHGVERIGKVVRDDDSTSVNMNGIDNH